MNINKIRQYLSEAKSPPWYMGLHKSQKGVFFRGEDPKTCLLYTSPSPRD